MKRSNERIFTTHTGSLPLPALVRQAFAAKRRGEAYDQAAIDASLTTAIGEVVRWSGARSKSGWISSTTAS